MYQCLTALLQTAQDLHKEHRDLIIEHLQKDLQSVLPAVKVGRFICFLLDIRLFYSIVSFYSDSWAPTWPCAFLHVSL